MVVFIGGLLWILGLFDDLSDRWSTFTLEGELAAGYFGTGGIFDPVFRFSRLEKPAFGCLAGKFGFCFSIFHILLLF